MIKFPSFLVLGCLSLSIAASGAEPTLNFKSCSKQDISRSYPQELAQNKEKFSELLAKRAELYFDVRIREAQVLAACASDVAQIPNFDRKDCDRLLNPFMENLRENFPKMRIHLALARPAIRERRLLVEETLWYSKKPKHLFAGMASLAPLSSAEVEIVRNEYLTHVSGVAEAMGVSDLKEKLLNKGNTLLNLETMIDHELVKSIDAFQFYHKRSYEKLLTENPLLPLVSSANPSKARVAAIFSDIKEKIIEQKNELEELSKRSDPAYARKLIKLRPVVESLLKEDKSFCSLAHALKDEQLKHQRRIETAFAITSIAGAATCFVPGLDLVCIWINLGVSSYNVVRTSKLQHEAEAQVVSPYLNDRDAEVYSRLDQTSKRAFISKVFFALSAVGAAKATLQSIQKVPAVSGPGSAASESYDLGKVIRGGAGDKEVMSKYRKLGRLLFRLHRAYPAQKFLVQLNQLHRDYQTFLIHGRDAFDSAE